MSTLVIVESPAKAHTISKFLGRDYTVLASVGHIRDLPEHGLGIDISDDRSSFTPKYVVPDDKKRVVGELVAAAKKADTILLASDPDREGEAIAWHLDEVLREHLGAKAYAAKTVRRVSYNEITRSAVAAAIANPRDIDMHRVDAQQTRRVIDRLVGWRVSPAVARGTHEKAVSAGRVQSVALRMVCEREDVIAAFKAEAYWEYAVTLRKTEGDPAPFTVRLRTLDGAKADVRTEEDNARVTAFLEGARYAVEGLETARKERAPGAPFTTSSLQQSAHSALHFSPEYTMQLAQRLYEGGFITYMRTDHSEISREAQQMAAEYVSGRFGAEYSQRRAWSRNAAGAQGAHEGIRPTDVTVGEDAVRAALDDAAARLYRLIWTRFVTSQMKAAVYDVGTLKVAATATDAAGTAPRAAGLTASVATLVFDGFLAATPDRKKEAYNPDAKKADADKGGREEASDALAALPAVVPGEALERAGTEAAQSGVAPERKETKPPAHFNEASLVRAMEKEGIGRPSTYAATIDVLKKRKYVSVTQKRTLSPTALGRKVVDFLVRGDARAPEGDALFYVAYTRDMEKTLDAIAREEEEEEVASPKLQVPSSEGAGKPETQSETVADWQRTLADFFRRLKEWLGGIKVTGPAEAFRAVLSKFSEVREWQPPHKDGKRTYDDRAFVQEIACDYMGEPRPKKGAGGPYRFEPAAEPSPEFRGTAGQLKYLLSILLRYREQVANLDDFGHALEAAIPADSPDAAELRGIVHGAFAAEAVAAEGAPGVMAVLEMLEKNGPLDADREFFESLRTQVRRGRTLSPRQTPYLFRMFHAAGQAGRIPGYGPEQCEAMGVPWQEQERVDEERVKAVVESLAQVKEWEPATERRGRTYDDKEFYEDVAKGWRERGRMFPKALAALEKMLARYRGQIPGAAALMERYGIAAPKERPARAASPAQSRKGAAAQGGGAADADPKAAARAAEVFHAFEGFDGWQPGRGRRGGDKTYFDSFRAQFRKKGSLSPKQMAILEKMLETYRAALPGSGEAKNVAGPDATTTP